MAEAQGDPVGGRFRVNRDAVAERVGEEIVLVHLTTDRMYVLNQTAARAWELLCAGHDAPAVRHRMLQSSRCRRISSPTSWIISRSGSRPNT